MLGILIVVGRTQPPLGAVSAMPLLDRWYERADAVRELADGVKLVQIIGRGRGVNRTADNPLDMLAMTDVPLPMAKTINAAALDLMLAEDETGLRLAGYLLPMLASSAIRYETRMLLG